MLLVHVVIITVALYILIWLIKSDSECRELTEKYAFYKYSPYSKYITKKEWEILLKGLKRWCCDEYIIKDVEKIVRGGAE